MTPDHEGRGDWLGAASRDHTAVVTATATNWALPPARQVALPTLPAIARSGPNVAFAHPAEQDLARLLTFYGVRWSYEPTMFALAGNGERPASEFFTPDFYLPEHHLYLELTTMRQRLVTRKNRKLRLVREHFPGVAIKLLYRRDYQRLVDAYTPLATPPVIEQVLATASEINARIEAIADALTADWVAARSELPPLLLALGAGAHRTHAALGQALQARGWPHATGRMAISRYQPAVPERARARVSMSAARGVHGLRVVVVQDVVSSGLSLACATGWLRRHGAAAVASCALLERPAARLLPPAVAHIGFSSDAPVVAGFGLRRYPTLGRRPDLVALAPAPAQALNQCRAMVPSA